MFNVKIVIADPKTGKCYQKEIEDDSFLGLKIGDKIKGNSFDFAGYEFEITGGSDSCGFPMRKDVEGSGRKKILVVSGVGAKEKNKGQRQRKTVRGNTISGKVNQVNLKILKYGATKLDAPAEDKAEGTEEEPKTEEKAAESKPEVKKSPENVGEKKVKVEEKKEEKAAESKPEENKTE